MAQSGEHRAAPANDAELRGAALVVAKRRDGRSRRRSGTALAVADVPAMAHVAPGGARPPDWDGVGGSGTHSAEELEAAAHALFARAHELLAQAARARHARPAADMLVSISEAARMAATSARVIREAIRRGDLAAYGRQRDRSVRSADLARWIETRRLAFDGPADADMERRVRRLAGQGKRSAA